MRKKADFLSIFKAFVLSKSTAQNRVFALPDVNCRHTRLLPHSGGYYIGCADCGVQWVAKETTGDADVDRGRRVPHGQTWLATTDWPENPVWQGMR